MKFSDKLNPPESGRARDLDVLTEVELKIARRADEFARTSPRKSLLNLHCWLMAEAELLGRNFGDVR